jgi:hypothetical protein
MQLLAVFAAMIGGAILGGFLARKETTGGQAPSTAENQDRFCIQVTATCADGSEAPTPCDCAGRGGVARIGGIA